MYISTEVPSSQPHAHLVLTSGRKPLGVAVECSLLPAHPYKRCKHSYDPAPSHPHPSTPLPQS